MIDTHAFVWATVEPRLLSERARLLLGEPGHEFLVSAVTAYEIEFKRERDPVLMRVSAALEHGGLDRTDFRWLGISAAHAAAAGRLPRRHGDPFDRLLVAQAIAEGAVLISADARLPAYDVEVIW